jgi:hypothetical protein
MPGAKEVRFEGATEGSEGVKNVSKLYFVIYKWPLRAAFTQTCSNWATITL